MFFSDECPKSVLEITSEYAELLIRADNLSKRIKLLIMKTESMKADNGENGEHSAERKCSYQQNKMINEILKRHSDIIGI